MTSVVSTLWIRSSWQKPSSIAVTPVVSASVSRPVMPLACSHSPHESAVAGSPFADYLVPVSPNSPCRPAGTTRQIGGPDGTPACAYPRFRETLPGGRSYDVLDQVDDGAGDEMEPVIVPEGQVFVMGDNRDDSLDSRFPVGEGGVGFLPVDHLLGRAAIAFWSTDGSAEWLMPWTWFSAARWNRIGQTW